MDLRFQREMVVRTQEVAKTGVQYLAELQKLCPHDKVVVTFHVSSASGQGMKGLCLFCGRSDESDFGGVFGVFSGCPMKQVSSEEFERDYGVVARGNVVSALLSVAEVEAMEGFKVRHSAA